MTIANFQKTILSWYKKNKRSMPWRNTKDPFKILVSEVMLQQTQVARVLAKYKEFIQEFPTLHTLAKASDKKLLKIWSGLGYWRRALGLKNTAKQIVKQYGGKFPKETKTLESFPGIGPYTARAIACFAFHNQDAFLDTNIRRVYLHFFFPGKKNVSDKEILNVAKKAMVKRDPREWHYALFDYGALVLKDKKINKQSRHYAKQSKFEGSFRSFRTRVVRFLLDQPGQTATANRVQRLLKKEQSPYLSEKILASLKKDGLVKKKGNSYSL
jgi:A/G-specific adenine glycosylase